MHITHTTGAPDRCFYSCILSYPNGYPLLPIAAIEVVFLDAVQLRLVRL